MYTDETKELSKMGELSESIYNDGYLEQAQRDLQHLMESTGWSLEKAMEMLCIPLEKKDYYEKKLKKRC